MLKKAQQCFRRARVSAPQLINFQDSADVLPLAQCLTDTRAQTAFVNTFLTTAFAGLDERTQQKPAVQGAEVVFDDIYIPPSLQALSKPNLLLCHLVTPTWADARSESGQDN